MDFWTSIPNWEAYQVTKCGQVRSLKRKKPRILKLKLDGERGYERYCVYLYGDDGQRPKKNVARLVLETFVGPCPEGMEACHIDGNSLNNVVDNLEWGTHKHNMMQRTEHGTTSSKLTKEQITIIRQQYATGKVTQRELADRYKVHQSQISRAIHQQHWAHVQGEEY